MKNKAQPMNLGKCEDTVAQAVLYRIGDALFNYERRTSRSAYVLDYVPLHRMPESTIAHWTGAALAIAETLQPEDWDALCLEADYA